MGYIQCRASIARCRPAPLRAIDGQGGGTARVRALCGGGPGLQGLAQFRKAWVRVGLYRSIGDVRADQGRAVESQAAYGRAIELANQIAATAPADDEAIRRFLGLLYLSAGREGEAVAVFGRDRVGLYLQMGLDLLAEGRLEPAFGQCLPCRAGS